MYKGTHIVFEVDETVVRDNDTLQIVYDPFRKVQFSANCCRFAPHKIHCKSII